VFKKTGARSGIPTKQTENPDTTFGHQVQNIVQPSENHTQQCILNSKFMNS